MIFIVRNSIFFAFQTQASAGFTELSSHTPLPYGLTFARESRMWKNTILSHLHITSHCLLQLVWLFITTSSRASHCSRPIRGKWFISGRLSWGKEVRCFGAVLWQRERSPARMDNPSEFGNSPEPCRGGGVQREPEWEAHIVHRRTPPAPARRHNSQGHGELGQRTSRLPTVRAGWEEKNKKRGKVSKVSPSVRVWLVKCVVRERCMGSPHQ